MRLAVAGGGWSRRLGLAVGGGCRCAGLLCLAVGGRGGAGLRLAVGGGCRCAWLLRLAVGGGWSRRLGLAVDRGGGAVRLAVARAAAGHGLLGLAVGRRAPHLRGPAVLDRGVRLTVRARQGCHVLVAQAAGGLPALHEGSVNEPDQAYQEDGGKDEQVDGDPHAAGRVHGDPHEDADAQRDPDDHCDGHHEVVRRGVDLVLRRHGLIVSLVFGWHSP